MKMSRFSLAILGATFLFSTSAFAQSENKGKLSVPETITVEGKQLPPGDYKVEWDGTGPNVEVKILKGKETVATVPARVVQTQSQGYGELLRRNQAAGRQPGYCLRFTSAERTYSLEIGQSSAQTTPAADAATR